MNKIKNLTFVALLALTALTGCKDGAFGGDEVPEGVELQDMCGTWSCTVETYDPWYTAYKYEGHPSYTLEFFNEYYGDPYGTFNPDANGDGIVDEKDLEMYPTEFVIDDEKEPLWYDEYEVGTVEFHTANSAANNTTEMVIKDGFWNEVFKVNVNHAAKTFSVGEIKNDPYQTLAINPVTINNTYDNGGKPVVLGGKILPMAATAPGSGMKRDSIIFYIKYSDDEFGDPAKPAKDLYYKVSGYRKTGYTED